MTLKILLVLTSLLFIVDGAFEYSWDNMIGTEEPILTMDSTQEDVYQYAKREFAALPDKSQDKYWLILGMLDHEIHEGPKLTPRLLKLADIVKELRRISELKEQVNAQYLELQAEKVRKPQKFVG